MARRKKQPARRSRVVNIDEMEPSAEAMWFQRSVILHRIRLNTIPACLGAARVPYDFGWSAAEIWLARVFIAD